ncbi:hypothetical protein PV341_07870 [Streptomyces sp. PA03-1a]|nr:hypothetical protein [Streptomyces sp. PA03-1a]
MSGCCGQGPVIVSGAAAVPRVDVETVLLCDVLPDGTVAGLALVEPVYDTISGDRVGTRIVDPATGAPYTPTGVLGRCGDPSPECARQISTRARCDDADGDGTGEVTYVEVWALDPCDGGAPQLLGSFLDGDFAAPYTPVGPVDCPDATADTPVVLGQICYDAGAGEIRAAAVLKCAACSSAAVTYLDVETGDPVINPVPVPCAAGVDRQTQLLCDVQADGTSTPFLRHFTTDPAGTTTTADTLLDGTTAYAPTGTVGVCLPAQAECASPTTPTATVGLCLADGTPIAVTVIRDCDGAVSSEGWINLLTGAYSAGAAPAGTVACGSSQSIQLSGTFCDVDPGTGDVLGLVLIEYSYDADGAIDSVRLVDAVTGATYTPTGTVTVCPAGVEQPDQDLVPLCDVDGAGVATQFVRDFRRDETGAIVGHSDYTLAGAAYTPTGTVGLCFEPCTTSQTFVLCDSTPVDLGPLLTFTDTDPTPLFQPNPPDGNVKRVNLAPGQPFWDGGAVTFAPPPGGEGTGISGTHRYIAASIGADAVECPPCGPAGDVTITVTGRACNQGPVLGVLTCGRWRIVDASTTPATTLANLTLSNVGASGNFPSCRDLTATATVSYEKLLSGDLAVSLDLETHDENGTEKTWIADQFAVTATLAPTAGCGTQFLRTIRTACSTGTVLSVTDTDLDGAPYTVSGDAAQCVPPTTSCGSSECRDCETLVLCDVPTAAPVTITGTAASGTLSNGVGWTSTGATNTTAMAANLSNADGSWWGLHSFPHAVTAATRWTFSRPSIVEFSVYVRYFAAAPTISHAQLQPGLEVVSLPDGYSYDETTGVLTRTSDAAPTDPCSYVTDPQIAGSARFRTAGAVTSFTTAPAPNSRVAACGVFFTYWAGAVSVVPGGSFLRQICRSCDGAATVTDTLLDGITPYTVAGTAGVCEPPAPPEPESCCQPAQVCIQQDPTQEVEFISNEGHLNDNSVDPVWKWTTDLTAANPPWYDMYEYQYSGAWSVVDSDTARPAWWVSPHPNGASAQSSPAQPNEGPSLLNAHWFPRAFFDLPDNADPATIQIQATVFNADQIGRAFRLNNGAWQALPATATHNGTTYTFGPATIPGAQAGRNFLYLDVEETVGGGSGLMVHLKVTYEVIPETRSWTRMVCCDDSVYYLDEDGVRQDAVPDGWHVAPCSSAEACSTVQLGQLCDLVSAPAEPIPVPADSFALAGNVVVIGDTLQFSRSNVPVTGVAQRSVTGLISGTASELLFEAGWGGGGSPPATNDAIYRADILDGATVLATSTVNLSNGSGSAGAVVAQPPLAFTAPSSGAVTVRFTDLSTGGALNRDLVIRPLTVETEGVELTAIPFLRAYAYDCTGLLLTATDTELDGSTAYTVQGEVGICSGTTTATDACTRQVVERCGCDDTNGDGVADTSYTELWAVDPCSGVAPELLGTYEDGDLAAPYTPVAPVDCEASETLTGEPLLLCDTAGPFLRHIRYAGDGTPVSVLDTDLDGVTPYTPVGAVGSCAGASGADAAVNTGLNRLTAAGTFDVKATAPGVQSATVTVLAGTAQVTTSSGTVTVPAGLSLTWSVADTDDSSLAVLSVTALAGADVVTNYTYKASAAG